MKEIINKARESINWFISFLMGKEEMPKLQQAAMRGDMRECDWWLSRGVDLNEKDKVGETALHKAAKADCAEVMEMLILRGANVNAVDDKGQTPLFFASSPNIARILLDNKAELMYRDKLSKSVLHSAAASGNIDVAQFFLAKKISIGATSVEGTPLHLAAKHGHPRMVDFLLSKGADKNAKANHNITPIYLASQHGHEEIVKTLEMMGADVNIADTEGNTPLHRAAENGFLEICRVLESRGAELNTRNQQGKTPLWLAKNNGKDLVVAFLKPRGGVE